MSDVTVAPQGAAAPPPAPVNNEVPINESPVSAPTPVGSQAPDKSPAEARRESVQKAFERASNPPPKGDRPKKAEAKPAEAKAGHNNPPEPTERLDLKKRPDEQPRERGEGGRFAPRARVRGSRSPGRRV